MLSQNCVARFIRLEPNREVRDLDRPPTHAESGNADAGRKLPALGVADLAMKLSEPVRQRAGASTTYQRQRSCENGLG